ncbi:MAG: hypothetical protein E7B11_10415 [Clostridiales bacterium]|nr:hypothetical protein [Clostridiales bacterium]MDU3240966.1 hypothetical protein [Clostridiales bacterium]
MDKFEYNAKLEEITRLAEQEEYDEAAKIADSIEWKRVRNVRTLCMISEIYEANGQLDDSKQILLRAYRRSPMVRSILYRLTEVAIKMREFDEAVEFYTEFVNAAPNDNSKYVLKYKLYKGRGSSLEEQIEILEEYKHKEYTEQWAYELAKLYHKAGLVEKCIEECDDITLWFHNGKYVVKALELKRNYVPLTPEQQTIYDNPSGIVDIKTKEETVTKAVPKLEKEILKGMPETEEEALAANIIAATEREIAASVAMHKQESESYGRDDSYADEEEMIRQYTPVKEALQEENIGKAESIPVLPAYNTADLQMELAKNMREILSGIKKPKDEDDMNPATVIGDTSGEEAAEMEAEEAVYADNQEFRGISIDDVLTSMSGVEDEDEADEDESMVDGYDEEDAEDLDDSNSVEYYDEDSDGEAYEESDEYDDSEDAMDEEDYDGEPDGDDLDADEEPLDEELPEYDADLEYDPDEDDDRDEDTVDADEVGEEFEYEENADEDAEDYEYEYEEEPEEVVEYEYDTDDEGIEYQDADEQEEESDALDETDMTDEQEMPDVVQMPNEIQMPDEVQMPDEIQMPEADDPGATIDLLAAIEAAANTSHLHSDMTVKDQMLNDVEESVHRVASDPMYHPAPELNAHVPMTLTESQKTTLGFFARIKGLDAQLAHAISKIREGNFGSGNSKIGNVVITGDAGSGRTTLGINLAKVISQEKRQSSAKVAKIYAEDFNKKDIPATISKIAGGTLIIEEAGDLDENAVEMLAKAMEFKTDGLIVILEDEKSYVRDLLARYPDLACKFNVNITIPIFTNDELVYFGKTYANDKDYHIEEPAVGLLYDRIGEIQSPDHAVTVADVKDIVDRAMKRVDRIGMRKLFSSLSGKRFDEEDRVLLCEKDFR